MRIVIKIENLDALKQALSRAEYEFQTALHKTMERSMIYLWGKVPPYPEKPENSTYVRTGNLQRSLNIGVETIGSRTVGKIGASIEYAPYVIGAEQAEVHQGRWYQLHAVVIDNLNGVIGIFEAWVNEVLRKSRLK